MALDLKSALVVVHCAKHGSVGQAAERLNMTQSAATRILLRLEQRLGARLFDRSARGVTVNEYGRVLLPHAELIVSESEHASDLIQQMLGAGRGVARIACVTAVVVDQLRRAIALLGERVPDVQVHILDGMQDELIDSLKLGVVDLAITTEPYDDNQIALACEDVFYDQVGIFARPGHPAHRASPLSMEVAAKWDWAMPPGDSPVAREWRKRFRGLGLEPKLPRIVSRSIPALSHIAMDMDILIWVPANTTALHRKLGLLREVSVPGLEWGRTFRIYKRSKGHLAPAAALFVQTLQEVSRESAQPDCAAPEDQA